jgi:hypothetical protein
LKFSIGDLPVGDRFFDFDSRWIELKEPSVNQTLLIGHSLSVLIPIILLYLFKVIIPFEFAILKELIDQFRLWSFPILILLLLTHELVHALTFPKRGFSDDTLITFAPIKGMALAFYKGELTRENFLLSLITPFFLLTILPLVYCLYDFHPLVFSLAIINSSFSSFDIFYFWVVARNSPQKSIFKNHGYKSYFRY